MYRCEVIPVVYRHAPDNIENIPGRRIFKMKQCSSCKKEKVFSDFYVKANTQHIRKDKLTVSQLRSQCITCHDVCTYNSKQKSKNTRVVYVWPKKKKYTCRTPKELQKWIKENL